MSKQTPTRSRNEPKDATQATRDANRRVSSTLPFKNRDDFEACKRGFLTTLPDAMIQGADGPPVWDLSPYHFLDSQDAPASVHPSLWRQAQLNMIHGLFQVTDRIYQVRNFDLSNMTIIEGDTGLILIDPLLSSETANA
ncbi:MAG: MBL fold metallo-hydrolase, partial [Ktedonobacteraceae bacterium]